jgi:outer membrane protein assembly factor BamA
VSVGDHAAGVVAQIQFSGLTSQLEEAILGKLPVQEGDSFQADMISRIDDVIKLFDEHLAANYHMLDFDGERRYFELRISYRVPVETAGK